MGFRIGFLADHKVVEARLYRLYMERVCCLAFSVYFYLCSCIIKNKEEISRVSMST